MRQPHVVDSPLVRQPDMLSQPHMLRWRLRRSHMARNLHMAGARILVKNQNGIYTVSEEPQGSILKIRCIIDITGI